MLSQCDDNGTEHPVAFYSRKLLPRKTRYSTIEKECLAIKAATHTFRVYLLGKKFIIQTDHRALEWLDRLKDDNARLIRWSLALQPYQFVVRYRSGKQQRGWALLRVFRGHRDFVARKGGGSLKDFAPPEDSPDY